MALTETNIDFSAEEFDQAVPFFEGCWVIAHKHNPGLSSNLELNNRTFVFKLANRVTGSAELVVFGVGDAPAVAAARKLQADSGLPVTSRPPVGSITLPYPPRP